MSIYYPFFGRNVAAKFGRNETSLPVGAGTASNVKTNPANCRLKFVRKFTARKLFGDMIGSIDRNRPESLPPNNLDGFATSVEESYI